jgi:hypothetical protein
MHIRIALVLVALAGLVHAEEWTKKFTVAGSPALSVISDDASVSVRPGASGAIEIRVVTEGWKIGPDEVRVIDHQTGDRVELEVRRPHRRLDFWHGWIRVEVVAPAVTAAEIRTGDGAISVEGLKGGARLHTGDGNVTAESLDGALDARTGDGRIVARGRFDTLTLHTGDGSVEAEAQAGSKLDTRWLVETGDGSVRLLVPRDLAADVAISTGDGHITCNLPLTINGMHGRSSVRGKLNGGGLPLTVRTGDGSIQVDQL